MKRSTKRILTTHTGSLPRPDGLLSLLNTKEAGELIDRAAFDEVVRGAVTETIRKQADSRVDVINDGEMSKPSYSTYVKDRLSGFEGVNPGMGPGRLGDIREFPEFGARMFLAEPGRKSENACVRRRDSISRHARP